MTTAIPLDFMIGATRFATLITTHGIVTAIADLIVVLARFALTKETRHASHDRVPVRIALRGRVVRVPSQGRGASALDHVRRAVDAMDAHPTQIRQPSTVNRLMVDSRQQVATNQRKQMTMTTTRNIILSSLLITSVANAQPIELAVGAGYMQGAGDIGGGMPRIDDVSREGASADLALGASVTPNLTIGGYGTLSGYNTGPSVAPATNLVIGASLGAKADYHFDPTNQIDPWVSLGAGWRGLWLGNEDGNTEQRLQGIDLARAQVGIDFRLTPGFALSPYVGASATMFVAKGDQMNGGYDEIHGKTVNFAVAGGLLARFDMFGTRGR
jgi:hypothetical protein